MGYIRLFIFVIVVTFCAEALQKNYRGIKRLPLKKCVLKPRCNPHYKYRTADGSCNNLKRKSWGQSDTKQRRFLKPDYEDGCQSPRETGYDKRPLPSTRVVSNKIHRNKRAKTKKDRKLNILLVSFGQFLSHDIALTPSSDKSDCCGAHRNSPQCMQIVIPRGDPFFKYQCMPLTRSDPFPARYGYSCYRRQINKVTAYVDASNVYGSTEKKAKELRSFKNGKMRQIKFGLPDGGSNCVFDDMNNDYCQNAGDGRQNVVPHLGATHLLFIRYHNIVVEKLAKLNSNWDDEKLYQETRRIVSAIMQDVVYNEYLPHILGPAIMEKYNLYSKSYGFDSVYDKRIDASMRNAVAVAALRYGHSQIRNVQKHFSKTYKAIESRKIENTFHHPHMCVRQNGRGGDGVLRWQLAERAAKMDGVIESGVRDKLFLDSNGKSFDLVARNLQRARDHGTPPYWKWRKFCGLDHTKLSDHTRRNRRKLLKLYGHIKSIDLYAGSITEVPVPGGIVGPTFACLLARQFSLCKRGDRFWYENNLPYTGFTEDQLNEIKKVTLSSIICESMDVDRVTRDAFRVKSKKNKRVKCSAIPKPSWLSWKA